MWATRPVHVHVHLVAFGDDWPQVLLWLGGAGVRGDHRYVLSAHLAYLFLGVY